MPIEVYQVKVSYEQKPYRKVMMETFGGVCYPSPSTRTKCGSAILEKDPNCPFETYPGIKKDKGCEFRSPKGRFERRRRPGGP